MYLVRLAWRNLLRNLRRTLLAGLAVGIGLAGLLFTDALFVGLQENMIRTATETFLGQGQIHRQGFRSHLEVELALSDGAELMARLDTDNRVRAAAPRTQFFAMISSPANVAATSVFGIDPDREHEVSLIHEAVEQGDASLPSGGVLIGHELAELLEVELGDRLIVTATTTGAGELTQEMVRVSGIFRFGARSLDDGVAFVPLEFSRKLLELSSSDLHEIAIQFRDLGIAGDRSHPFWRQYSGGDREVLGWRDLLPELDAMLELSQFSMFVVLLILFGVVALSVINTLFMSLHERTFEFGVLRAVGTRPRQLFLLIVLEAACLSLISIAIGSLFGLTSTALVAHTGIDYSGIDMAGVTITRLVHPVITVDQYVMFPAWVLGFALVASIYPATYAARMEPAQAMRRSL
ncbi:MAG: FtsX-like permease family protein [Candidatus Latescibacterota bacterium]|nr:FtsX-like permease family protein [Candidatus Latescibacterota bacterium]